MLFIFIKRMIVKGMFIFMLNLIIFMIYKIKTTRILIFWFII